VTPGSSYDLKLAEMAAITAVAGSRRRRGACSPSTDGGQRARADAAVVRGAVLIGGAASPSGLSPGCRARDRGFYSTSDDELVTYEQILRAAHGEHAVAKSTDRVPRPPRSRMPKSTFAEKQAWGLTTFAQEKPLVRWTQRLGPSR